MIKKFYTSMIALITVVSTLIIFIPSSSAAPKNPKISGFFVASQNTDMKNYDMLKDIKNHGGDTVITFGYTLNKSTFQNSRQGVWSECYINKKRCIDSVKSGINVRNVLTYTGNTGFTKKQKLCSRDIFVQNNNRSYAIFVVPVNGTCQKASKYDIVMTTHSGTDAAKSLSNQAHKLGMKHYIGMPSPDKNTKNPWLPNVDYLDTLTDFTKRFVKANDSTGIQGYYQHREMPLSTHSSWNNMLKLYTAQNNAVSQAASSKNKNVLLSPYIDARKFMNQSPKQAEQAIQKMANTKGKLSSLIIAPQDGAGTGKGTPYHGKEWHHKVDPFQRTVVGNVTNNQAYLGSSADYFSAMKKGLKNKKNVHLWANVEGMAPVVKSGANKNVCSTGHNDTRGYTWKSRLKKQVDNTSAYTGKTISYHWNYYNCPINNSSVTPKSYLKSL